VGKHCTNQEEKRNLTPTRRKWENPEVTQRMWENPAPTRKKWGNLAPKKIKWENPTPTGRKRGNFAQVCAYIVLCTWDIKGSKTQKRPLKGTVQRNRFFELTIDFETAQGPPTPCKFCRFCLRIRGDIRIRKSTSRYRLLRRVDALRIVYYAESKLPESLTTGSRQKLPIFSAKAWLIFENSLRKKYLTYSNKIFRKSCSISILHTQKISFL
jgi:hypothetical protein